MKKLLLTGGSGDIGSAIKEKFENNGYYVDAPSRNILDLKNPQSINNFFYNKHDNYHAFVHCAGYNEPELIETLPFEKVQETLQINVLSFYQMLQHLTPILKNNGGKIVAISSLYGITAREGRAAYVMSKHALNGLVKTAALELGQYNVLINSVTPGFVDTKMTRQNNNQEKIRSFESKIPLGHLANTIDIAQATYYLCSDENNYITGQDIIVDGGFIVGGYQR